MGHVIAFPVYRSPYPDFVADRPAAESVILLSLRWWVPSYRADEGPIPRLRQSLSVAGAAKAAFLIDSFMSLVACVLRRPADIGCPRLSGDEKHLLHAADLVQARDCDLARKVLRTTLLSADGAAFAIGSLECLGDVFAGARLFLGRRSGDVPDRDAQDNADIPSASHSVH